MQFNEFSGMNFHFLLWRLMQVTVVTGNFMIALWFTIILFFSFGWLLSFNEKENRGALTVILALFLFFSVLDKPSAFLLWMCPWLMLQYHGLGIRCHGKLLLNIIFLLLILRSVIPAERLFVIFWCCSHWLRCASFFCCYTNLSFMRKIIRVIDDFFVYFGFSCFILYQGIGRYHTTVSSGILQWYVFWSWLNTMEWESHHTQILC